MAGEAGLRKLVLLAAVSLSWGCASTAPGGEAPIVSGRLLESGQPVHALILYLCSGSEECCDREPVHMIASDVSGRFSFSRDELPPLDGQASLCAFGPPRFVLWSGSVSAGEALGLRCDLESSPLAGSCRPEAPAE